MNAVIMPVLVLGLTGLAMGLFLAFASKKFEVEVDPKIEQIMGILPGANCGGCGFPGCAGYAVVNEGAGMSLCAPGGASVAEGIGQIMGATVEVSDEKIVAKVLCQGDNTRTTKIYEFDGELQTCAAMMLYAGGDKSCVYSCLGHGDCERVCPVNAIKVNDKGTDIKEVDVFEYICWKDNMMMLNGRKVGETLDRLSRYYGRNIWYNEEIGNIPISGKLDLRENMEDVINIICQSMFLQYKTDANNNIIISK